MDKEGLEKLIAQHFHHPDDSLCGSCGGLLEFTRDAICYRCSPEPEVVALADELDALKSHAADAEKAFDLYGKAQDRLALADALAETVEALWESFEPAPPNSGSRGYSFIPGGLISQCKGTLAAYRSSV